MANGGDARIDLRGDGRVILYKRKTLKILFGRLASVFQDQREAERFALNYYEELYIHVKTGGSIKSKTSKSTVSLCKIRFKARLSSASSTAEPCSSWLS